MPNPLYPERAAPLLLHAHPGHELRLFHWMECTRPIVLAMTDGSGGDLPARTRYSARCVASAGARWLPGPEPASDRLWYEAILRQDIAPFRALVDTICTAAWHNGCNLIVSDGVDGYNPMHDLCEAVAAAAAARLAQGGTPIAHLVSHAMPAPGGAVVTRLRLDDAARRRKLQAVHAYYPLAGEAQQALAADPDALAEEVLRAPAFAWPEGWVPAWEETARTRVRDGRYGQTIGYARDVRPIARALLQTVPA